MSATKAKARPCTCHPGDNPPNPCAKRYALTECKAVAAAKTNAERQREFRQRKADTETTEVRGIFAHPDDHAEVKEAAAKIARKRQRVAKRAAP
jgi:hypothetical protein